MIVVVGSINLDLISDVERIPAPGETVSGSGFRSAPGGKGANQALAAKRAGADTQMVGAVGKDGFAAQALELLKEGGVDLSVVRESHAPTGIALIMVDTKGENIIAVAPGANHSVLEGDLSRLPLEAEDVVLLQLEIPLPTVGAAMDAAAKAGARSVLNTAPFVPQAADLLGRADFIVANETEFDLYAKALGLPGKDRAEKMQAFVATTGKVLVVTLGGDGVVAVTPQGSLAVPALKIEPVDTVGAGDTFCGYFGAGIAAGLSLEDALRRASVAGSLACLKPGAQPAIPLVGEVEEALPRLGA